VFHFSSSPSNGITAVDRRRRQADVPIGTARVPQCLADGSAICLPGQPPSLFYFDSPAQRAVVVELWRAAFELRDVAEAVLLRAAGVSGTLADLFSRSPAWGRVIVPGNLPGTYRLAL
jgi:hypothetical protein